MHIHVVVALEIELCKFCKPIRKMCKADRIFECRWPGANQSHKKSLNYPGFYLVYVLPIKAGSTP
jgi:hypothetical protein